MAGLLLELRRQIARNRRKDAYGKPTDAQVHNGRHKDDDTGGKSNVSASQTLNEPVKSLRKEETVQQASEGNIQERNIDVVSKEDFLLSQIDEFRERAKQLQTLLNSRESEAQELKTLVDERQEKADELDQILKERQEKADGLTAEVEKQVDILIEKVAAKMEEIEASMKEDVADGKRLNEEKAKEIKDTLAQIEEQLPAAKTELSDKVHTENVKCYRNISDLFRGMEERLDKLTVVDNKLGTLKVMALSGVILGGINLIALIFVMLISLGLIRI